MAHFVLLGDSVFDNGSYVPEGRDVAARVQQKLGTDSRVTLLAADGLTVEDINTQVAQIPDAATHIGLSAGGNDALYQMRVLTEETKTMSDALSKLADIQDRFAVAYQELIDALLALQKPIVVCTIYHPAPLDADFQPEVAPALSIFNDVILRVAFEERLPVVETRLVCNEESDFVYFIEPSETGGAKIAEVLIKAVGLQSTLPQSQVFAI